jgi:hypothetical protein
MVSHINTEIDMATGDPVAFFLSITPISKTISYCVHTAYLLLFTH